MQGEAPLCVACLKALRCAVLHLPSPRLVKPAPLFPPSVHHNLLPVPHQAELFNPRCLFLFGTYTIGKERLFLHVASALRRKVYVAAAKRSIMSCLDLPPHLADLLTTNHLDASIHAVSEWCTGFARITRKDGGWCSNCMADTQRHHVSMA